VTRDSGSLGSGELGRFADAAFPARQFLDDVQTGRMDRHSREPGPGFSLSWAGELRRHDCKQFSQVAKSVNRGPARARKSPPARPPAPSPPSRRSLSIAAPPLPSGRIRASDATPPDPMAEPRTPTLPLHSIEHPEVHPWVGFAGALPVVCRRQPRDLPVRAQRDSARSRAVEAAEAFSVSRPLSRTELTRLLAVPPRFWRDEDVASNWAPACRPVGPTDRERGDRQPDR
jgi:hypothetical protein